MRSGRHSGGTVAESSGKGPGRRKIKFRRPETTVQPCPKPEQRKNRSLIEYALFPEDIPCHDRLLVNPSSSVTLLSRHRSSDYGGFKGGHY